MALMQIFVSLHRKIKAQMAKLVDALVSGTSVLTDVQVRVLFWAHWNIANQKPGWWNW